MIRALVVAMLRVTLRLSEIGVRRAERRQDREAEADARTTRDQIAQLLNDFER